MESLHFYGFRDFTTYKHDPINQYYMSNIDFNVLDDILTSPLQPSAASKDDGTEAILQKDENLPQNRALLHSPSPETTNNSEKGPNEANVSSGLDTAQEASGVEKLLEQQSLKLSLNSERNALIKKRATLKDSIEEMKDRLKILKEKHQTNVFDEKMEKYLEDNNEATHNPQELEVHQYKGDITLENLLSQKRLQEGLQNNENDSLIISNLNVLPSNNWEERLHLVKRFYPHLEIAHAKTTTSYDDTEKLIRTISYSVTAACLFALSLRVAINAANESIAHILLQEDKPNQLTTLHLLSPALHKVVLQNYLPGRKIDLLMYTLSDFSVLLHRRISTIYKIIRLYRDNVPDTTLSELCHTEEISNTVKVFSILKSVNSIHIEIPKDSTVYRVSLLWNIIVADVVTGTCSSSFELFIARKADNHLYESANPLFQKLVAEYGVFAGLTLIIKNTFGVEPLN